MKTISRLLSTAANMLGQRDAPILPKDAPQLRRASDPWFWSHYETVAQIVMSEVPRSCLMKGSKVLDFGCGDGAATLGVASHSEASVVGVDLMRSFAHLPALAEQNLGKKDLPSNLTFMQNQIDQPLAIADQSIDLVYSWSVLEHVSNVAGVMAECARIIKPKGYLFIQIDPLFHSPFGSHLQRLIKQPWAHLLYEEDEYLRLVSEAKDDVPLDQQDTLYRNNNFADVKRYLIGEYQRLNRIEAKQLTEIVTSAGFDLISTKFIMAEGVEPSANLIEKYSLELLMTQQIVILGQKA